MKVIGRCEILRHLLYEPAIRVEEDKARAAKEFLGPSAARIYLTMTISTSPAPEKIQFEVLADSASPDERGKKILLQSFEKT